jgi:hypothetical protein
MGAGVGGQQLVHRNRFKDDVTVFLHLNYSKTFYRKVFPHEENTVEDSKG